MIRPADAAPVYINRTVHFTEAAGARLQREAPPVTSPPTSGIPWWVWLLLAAAAALVLALTVAVRKLSRRPAAPAA